MSETENTIAIYLDLPHSWAEFLNVLDSKPGTMRVRVGRVVEELCRFAVDELEFPLVAPHRTGRAWLIAMFGAQFLARLDPNPSRPGHFLPCRDALERDVLERNEERAAQLEQEITERYASEMGFAHAFVDETAIARAFAALEVDEWHAGVTLKAEAAEAICVLLCDLEVERRVLRERLADEPARAEVADVTDEDVQRLAARMYEVVMDTDPSFVMQLGDEPEVERERWLSAARIGIETGLAAAGGAR